MEVVKWSDMTMAPDAEALASLRCSWQWLLGDDWSALLFSIFGDVFLEMEDTVQWLNTGTGDLSSVAKSRDEFRSSLAGESADDWFLPGLVHALHEAGKRPADGQCFTYVIYPIFAEGKYEVENFNVVPAREHFSLSGDLHREIAELPEGSKVRLVIKP